MPNIFFVLAFYSNSRYVYHLNYLFKFLIQIFRIITQKDKKRKKSLRFLYKVEITPTPIGIPIIYQSTIIKIHNPVINNTVGRICLIVPKILI